MRIFLATDEGKGPPVFLHIYDGRNMKEMMLSE